MKKLLLLVFGLSFTALSYSQFADGAVKLNLFAVVVGQYQLGYEHALNENSSVQLSAGIISRTWDGGVDFGGGLNSSFEQKNSGFIVIPEYRYYFAGEALKGVYAGAFARYRSSSIEYTTTSGTESTTSEFSRSAVGGGAILGYQFIISDKVLIDLFLGPQYKSVSTTVDVASDDFDLNLLEGESDGVGLRFGLNFGITL
ncbi:MAG: DUF3575 domain-containing protein [Bacteroidota bacterium]